MGELREHSHVLPVMATFSCHPPALDWARDKAAETWGDIALESPLLSFDETDYYESTMGAELRIRLLAFARLMSPVELVERKLQTNLWESAYAQQGAHSQPRPLNLDPGYVTPAKLVLASTKDHSHRLYLDRGIFAEVTLHYSSGCWNPRRWTYPNYRRADYHEFLTECRGELRRLQRKAEDS